jgi:hypothetical protein
MTAGQPSMTFARAVLLRTHAVLLRTSAVLLRTLESDGPSWVT